MDHRRIESSQSANRRLPHPTILAAVSKRPSSIAISAHRHRPTALRNSAKRAHIFPATPAAAEDPAILAAMLNVIIQEQLYDADFTSTANVAGFRSAQRALNHSTPDYVANAPTVPAAKLIEAARVFRWRAIRPVSACGVAPQLSSMNGP